MKANATKQIVPAEKVPSRSGGAAPEVGAFGGRGNDSFSIDPSLLGPVRAIPVVFCALVFSLSLVGCLETRSAMKEQEEKQILRKQVANLQMTSADVSSKFSDMDEDIRRMGGRIEVIENRMGQTNQRFEKGDAALDARFRQQEEKLNLLKEDLVKVAGEVAEMRGMMSQIQGAVAQALAQPSGGGSKDTKSGKKQSAIEMADQLFEKKNYQEAILKYEEYRNANPKGKRVASALFRIGVSFEELGLKDEAATFFEDVVRQFPKSKEAGIAQTRLKKLKKRG